MASKLFEKQLLNPETGEVTSISSVRVSKHEETFGMHRTTEGIDWIFKFSGNELQMLMVLLNIEDVKTGFVELSTLKKKHLLESFKCSKQMFNRILKNLEIKGALVRVTNTDLLLNPSYFYQGGTAIWKSKNDNFKKYKAFVKETSSIK